MGNSPSPIFPPLGSEMGNGESKKRFSPGNPWGQPLMAARWPNFIFFLNQMTAEQRNQMTAKQRNPYGYLTAKL